MPNELILQVKSGQLPVGACPQANNYQALADLLASIFSVTFPSTFSGVSVGSTPPEDQTQAWLQLDTSGRFIRTYTYAQGAWLSQHPLQPGFVMIWPFALPDFTTFDGGDSNMASAVSGPMWQLAQDGSGNQILQARFPLGVGTLPSSKAVAVGQTGGEETHKLDITETPPHTHLIENVVASDSGNFAGGGFNGAIRKNIYTDSTGGDPTTGNPPTGAKAHNTMPPYYGVYYLQRTNRLFYAVT